MISEHFVADALSMESIYNDFIKVNDKGSAYLYRSYGNRNDLFSMTLKIFLIVGEFPCPHAFLNLCSTAKPLLTTFNYAKILK